MSDSRGPWDLPEPPPPARRRSRLGLGLALAVAALIALGVWGLFVLFPGQISTTDDWGFLIRGLGVLLLVAGGLVSLRRIRLGEIARAVAGWVVIAGVLVLGFAYRAELTDAGLRLRGALVPGYVTASGPHELTLSADDSGGYRVTGQVNGQPVTFMVDTGSSDIVLSPADAERVGINPATLRYTRTYETANGEGVGAPFTANSLEVGPIRLANIEMSVNRTPMRSSLLGMAFLKRLASFEVRHGRLFLRW